MDGRDRSEDLGNYALRRRPQAASPTTASLDLLTLEYLDRERRLRARHAGRVHRDVPRYEAAGVDLLLCLVNPYKIPHETVMQTIELMGEQVIPEFR